jgi:hypothetical protein
MKIGDKIIIDKEYYIKKYRETFGNDIEIDGLTNDNNINGCLKRAIKNQNFILITDIDIDENCEVYIHFKDYEDYEGCILSKYIKPKEYLKIEKYKINIEIELNTNRDLSKIGDLNREIIKNFPTIDYLLSNSSINSQVLIKN